MRGRANEINKERSRARGRGLFDLFRCEQFSKRKAKNDKQDVADVSGIERSREKEQSRCQEKVVHETESARANLSLHGTCQVSVNSCLCDLTSAADRNRASRKDEVTHEGKGKLM